MDGPAGHARPDGPRRCRAARQWRKPPARSSRDARLARSGPGAATSTARNTRVPGLDPRAWGWRLRPRQKFVGDAGLGKGCHRIGWLGWSCVTSTWRLAGPMTGDSVPLAGLLAKAGGDFLRSVAEPVGPSLTETDVEGVIGGGRHERGGEHRACRNGHRDPAPGTRAGRPQRRIPGRRQDRGFPPFPEHRKTPERRCRRSSRTRGRAAGRGCPGATAIAASLNDLTRRWRTRHDSNVRPSPSENLACPTMKFYGVRYNALCY